MKALAALSVVLLALRLYAATRVGFGDSEALYAAWAAHPQPAYLDHPGLVALAARSIGQGSVPTPFATHVVTSIVATAIPWLVFGAAIAANAPKRRAAMAAIVVALVPEIAVGLFALTPDLLLAPLWLGSLSLAAIALSSRGDSPRAAGAFLGAGLLAGIAVAAKVSGLLLWCALFATYASVALSTDAARARARTAWPWAGLACGMVVVSPIALWEATQGFPMLRHRFVDTQDGSGLVLRNAGALVLGQLVYVSPILVYVAYRAARSLFVARNADAISRLLFFATTLPLLPLTALVLWSRVAEPHWIAPALLALPLHAARHESSLVGRKVHVAGAVVAALVSLGAHAYALVPVAAELAPRDTDPKLDIASELYGWPTVLEAVREQTKSAATPFDPEGREVVLIGPHWTVCAQLSAGLPGVPVGCATPIPDDFDRWFPRDSWRRADHVLFVTDNRFGGDGAEQLPSHVPLAQSRVRIFRGGRVARSFELYLYARRGQAFR